MAEANTHILRRTTATPNTKYMPRTMLRPRDTRSGARLNNKGEPPTLAVLIGLLSMDNKEGDARRSAQRRTWISASLRTLTSTPWRYFYACGRSNSTRGPLDTVEAGIVTLSRADDTYAFLFVRVLEMIRWALDQVPFRVFVKADDDSYVHVQNTIDYVNKKSSQHTDSLYAGSLTSHSPVIRPLTKKSVSQLERRTSKWAVSYEALPKSDCVKRDGRLYHQTYHLGGGYMLGNAAARVILRRHDARSASQRRLSYPEDAYVGLLAHKEGLNATRVMSHDFYLDGNLSCDRIRGKSASRESWFFLHRMHAETALRDFLILTRGCRGSFAINPRASLSG